MTDTLKLTTELINRKTLTPDDNGCQKIIAERLNKNEFSAKHLRFDDVDNLWVTHGNSGPLFVFAGHTDTVPVGPIEKWNTDPFKAEIKEGYLYGRGAADMKSGIAAMVTAAERYVEKNPNHNGVIALLITSDEEGLSINGTRKVIDYLNENKIKIDWCVVGEPSSNKQLADVIRIGRRGSLNGILKINGIQGHVAYPDKADNPIHKASEFLSEITSIQWDQGNDSFPPTSFQISNINAGTGADNVIDEEKNITLETADNLPKNVTNIVIFNIYKLELENPNCRAINASSSKYFKAPSAPLLLPKNNGDNALALWLSLSLAAPNKPRATSIPQLGRKPNAVLLK